MPNMRIVADNAIDRATLTASSTAGALVVTNLQSDEKSEVWRAAGSTARLSALWPAAETIQAVALPFCNLSPTATMRVRLTNEPSVTNLFLFSEQFDNAGWLKSRVTVPTNNSLAPDGNLTACTLQGDGTTGSNYVYQSKSLNAGGSYPVSCFVKAGTFTGVFNIHDFTESGNLSFDLTTLAVVTSGTFSSGKAVSFGNGWYRISAICKPTVTGSHNIGLWNTVSAGTTNVLVWGAMMGSGSGTLTSYYPSGATAGVRPLGYIDSWQSYDYDSGNVLACPAPAIKLRGWTAAQSASAYAYGGGATERLWLPSAVQAVGMAIDIADPANLQGYIEAACLVAGPYWSPSKAPGAVSSVIVDTTLLDRTAAGGQTAEAGFIYRRVPVDLGLLPATDRAACIDILRGSRAYPILVSLFPENADLVLERDHMVYGRRTKDSETPLQIAMRYSTTIDIEEI